MSVLDPENHPNLRFRIDSFSLPAGVRGEFDSAMQRNADFLATLPGYRGHFVFEKTNGPTSFDLVTIAVWDSEEAMEKASAEVRAYYAKIGFDPAATIARWGAKAEIGIFRAVPEPKP